jgi:hypothetical protein
MPHTRLLLTGHLDIASGVAAATFGYATDRQAPTLPRAVSGLSRLRRAWRKRAGR